VSGFGRAIVAGRIAATPGQGGAAWAVLQWVLGLREFSDDVWFVERLTAQQVVPAGASLEDSDNARYFHAVMSRFGLSDRAALILGEGDETVGPSAGHLREVARDARVLVDLSGVLAWDSLTSRIPLRLYVDMDPGFTQLWHAVIGEDVGLAGHTHYATYGQTIGRPGSRLPECGVTWFPTLPPVVLEQWPVAGHIRRDAFTTVANWRSYGSIEHDGRSFGQKAHSFRGLAHLPTLTATPFFLALSIDPEERADLELLRRHGWGVGDAGRLAGSPDGYQRFVQDSRAELGIAKSGYVVEPTGWFSDRSACYLASGRPVVAQDTGFGAVLPTGEGLVAFGSAEEAAAIVEFVMGDYQRHALAARAIAEEYLDSRKVLGTLLRQIGAIA